jgi:hypothetical protein
MDEDLWYILITHAVVLLLLLLFKRKAARKTGSQSVFNILIVFDIINFVVAMLALFDAFRTLHATDGFVIAFGSFAVGMLFLLIGIIAWLTQILRKGTFKN